MALVPSGPNTFLHCLMAPWGWYNWYCSTKKVTTFPNYSAGFLFLTLLEFGGIINFWSRSGVLFLLLYLWVGKCPENDYLESFCHLARKWWIIFQEFSSKPTFCKDLILSDNISGVDLCFHKKSSNDWKKCLDVFSVARLTKNKQQFY